MLDLKALSRFSSKKYRDVYMQSRVRGGIANQIQALRAKVGLTQAAFATLTGKKQSVISRLEDTAYGKMSVQTLLDIATALDVALLVRFVSYPEFLARTADMSQAALQPATIHESLSAPIAAQAPRRLPTPPANWVSRPVDQWVSQELASPPEMPGLSGGHLQPESATRH